MPIIFWVTLVKTKSFNIVTRQEEELGRSSGGGQWHQMKGCRLDVSFSGSGQNPYEGWNDRDPPPKAFPTHPQAYESCYNHPHPQLQSSVILWFHHSIFKPVEWECFWVPCSHRWRWEGSQEYACSRCPLHYVITPSQSTWTNMMLSQSHRNTSALLTAAWQQHTYVRDTKEGISPSYTHLAMHIARIQHTEHGHFCILAPQTGKGGHTGRGKKKKWTQWKIKIIQDISKFLMF